MSYIRELTVMESLSASLALRDWKPSVTDELHRSAVDFTHKGRFLWSNCGHPNPPLTKISLDSRHPQFPDTTVTSWHRNAFRITCRLWDESPVTGQMASNAELWWFWYYREQPVEQAVKFLVTLNALMPLWCQCLYISCTVIPTTHASLEST